MLTHTVLIVDDTVQNIDVLKGILSDEYHLKVATNGMMAIKVAEKTMPDIILMDIMMPGMDGYETCARLKANPLTQNIPVIFVTAKNQDMDEAKGFEVGAVDYITKPVSPIITKVRIKTHIALKNQNAELEKLVLNRTSELTETRLEIIKRLCIAAEYKDIDTGLHIERVSKYAYYIAKSYGLEESYAQILSNSVPMHDIGKIGVPEEILHKPGKLTYDEFETIKTHCKIGAEIIGEHSSDLLKAARIVSLQHHEKWDGTGYPNCLVGESIHIYARITAVADVFDALTSKRPYKEAWTNEAALNYIIMQSGQHFDPKVIEAFQHSISDIYSVKNSLSD